MSLLSTSELNSFMSDMNDHFDQFSSNHSLVIYKRAQQILSTPDSNTYFGYGQDAQNADNITYQTISGVFPCMVITPSADNKDIPFSWVPFFLVNGEKIIKVKQDAKQFIENGIANDVFILDSETFRKISSSVLKKYGNNLYYYFKLGTTT